jgi:hypothetical protein
MIKFDQCPALNGAMYAFTYLSLCWLISWWFS